MSTQRKFHNFIQEEKGLFPSICDMMQHSQVESGRQFLCAMNNIIDYYKTKDNSSVELVLMLVPWSKGSRIAKSVETSNAESSTPMLYTTTRPTRLSK